MKLRTILLTAAVGIAILVAVAFVGIQLMGRRASAPAAPPVGPPARLAPPSRPASAPSPG